MKISTVDKAVRIYWKIWSVFIIILSLSFLVYGLKVYLNEPKIIQQVINLNKNIYSLQKEDKISWGGKIWKVDYVYSGNNENYYSMTLTDY